MNKQQLITVFSIATLVNGLGQEKISIIGSSVVINNFESKLNIYNKNYSDKNLQKYKGRIIIMVKNNYKENDNIVLENKFFLKTSYLNLGVYYNTYSDIFFTKEFFNTVIQGKLWESYDKIFIFEDLDWKGLVKKFSDIKIELSAGSTVMRHTLSITHLKLIRFIVDIESEEESAELIIKNSFKLSKDIHKNHLIETFSKDKKIWLIREKIRSINPKIYVLYCKYLYLYNKYYPSLIDIIFDEMDKPDLINFKLHLKKMRSNEDVLVEFEDLNEKNFNLPLQKYDKKHNSFFKSIEELNIAIELYKNQGLKNKVKKTNATQKRVKKNKNINKISTGNINSSRKYHTSTSIFNTYKKDFSITTTLDTINDEISEINNNDVIENLGDLGIAVTGKQSAISYLDMIRNVVQNSQLDPFKTQLYIEKSSIDFEKKKLEDEKYLLTTHGHILYKLIFEAKKTLEILYEKKELKLKFPTLNGELNKIEYLFLVFSLSITYYGRLDWTAMSSLIGNTLTYKIYTTRLNRDRKAVKKLGIKKDEIIKNIVKEGGDNKDEDIKTYDKFIEEIGFTSLDFIKLGDFFLQLLSQYPHNIFEREFSKSYYYSRENAKLIINPKYLNDIKQNIIIHPSALPMLTPPGEWSETEFGGYLENINKQTNLITGSLIGQTHRTENLGNLYKAVNNLQKIKFEINKELLEFIKNEGSFLLHKLNNKSEELQRDLTLKIADIFLDIPFYLPVNSDWRTRVYTQGFFISYQGGDLSTALVNFRDGEKLNEEGKYYLYLYGANNHNESNLSKKSFLERIKWVEDNYDKIINLDKKLILEAENKFIFTGFCLNMKKLEESNFTAIIKTPVFLDATCSGIQHLSAMMKDLELAKKVNLTKSNKTDTPYDLYSEIIEPVNILLNNFGKENIEHAALSLVKFTRKEIKPIVMTKVYNISVYGIAQQLSSSFKRETLIKEINSLHEKIVNGIKDGLKKKQQSKFEVEYYAPGIDGEVILTRKNIYKIAELINDKIFLLFPSLNYIYTYLKNISKFMIKLNLPLTWITPSGIKINQNYLKTKTKKLPINLFGSKKTLVIKESLNVTDNYKQINAIIPNIIHSLDAAHLMNLINTSKEKGIGPVITVHDCFGTLPNNMEKLQLEVKKEFILLYTQHAFLETFHNRVIQTIRDNNIEVIEIDGLAKYVLFFNETIEIPQLPISGKLDLEDVKHSTYMIS